MEKQKSLRGILIDAIWEYSSDEYEGPKDMLDLAKESEQQLAERLINILAYYHANSNELF
jgi:hypothetical protein